MANHGKLKDWRPLAGGDEEWEFKYQELAIGGTLVRCTVEIPAAKVISFSNQASFENYVKDEIAKEMIKYMLSNYLIEFTRTQNPDNLSTRVNARCYLAPNDQVKLLRTHYNV